VAQELDESGSVFDFIYVDHRRIDLYLAQFSEFGSLTKLVRSVRASDAAQLGVSAYIARGETKRAQETGIEKHYDPQWIAPLSFLDEIQARGMLKPRITDARIGDLVILSGTLNMVDMRAFQKAFDTMSGTKSTSSGPNRKERRSGTQQTAAMKFDANVGLRLLASLDQPIFMLFVNEDGKYWSTMDQAAIVGSSTDLHLKHGVTIAGEWQTVGIVDCLPGVNINSPSPRFCGDVTNSFSDNMNVLLRELRLIMGRPSDCYGITPLIIMREVS
jgi:hypothetical protein